MEPLDTVLDTWRLFAMRFSAVCFGCSPSSCSCCCKSIHTRRGEFLILSMTFIFLDMATKDYHTDDYFFCSIKHVGLLYQEFGN